MKALILTLLNLWIVGIYGQSFQEDWIDFKLPKAWSMDIQKIDSSMAHLQNPIGKISFIRSVDTADIRGYHINEIVINYFVYPRKLVDSVGSLAITTCAWLGGNPNPNSESKLNVEDGKILSFSLLGTNNYLYYPDCLDFYDSNNNPLARDLLLSLMYFEKNIEDITFK